MTRPSAPLRFFSPSYRCRVTVHALVLTVFVIGALASTAAFPQGVAPVIFDADQVSYDEATQIVEASGHVSVTYRGVQFKAEMVRVSLREGRLEARGRVSVVDRDGHEMHATVVTYDAQKQTLLLSTAEVIVNGVYIRSTSLRAEPGHLVAGESTITTCNPECPGYHITASHVDAIPGERVAIDGATFWIGNTALFSVPVMTISLRSPRETAGSLPSIGFSNTDGVYGAYRLAVGVGTPLAFISTSVGTLAQRAEGGVVLPSYPLGFVPLELAGSVSDGGHREFTRNVDTNRFQWVLGLQTPPIRLGSETEMRLFWSWTDATYGTGAHQQIVTSQSAITQQLSPDSTLTLGYQALLAYGTTPLALDTVNSRDIVNELDLTYQRTGTRAETVATTLTAGFSYDYVAQALFALTTYGERIPQRYHWQLGPKYNLTTGQLSTLSDSGVAVGTDVYVTVQAEYNTVTTVFKDLDYILTAPIADCFELSIKYRQMRQELWISVGVSPAPRYGGQFPSQGP
jgi:lipopolysaccharide export system protein LptA